MQGFLKSAANGHRFTNRFHLGGQDRIRARKFFKGKAGDFGHDIINSRFKAGGSFFRDVVGDFVEGIANGKFGRKFGDREAGGFGGEGG